MTDANIGGLLGFVHEIPPGQGTDPSRSVREAVQQWAREHFHDLPHTLKSCPHAAWVAMQHHCPPITLTILSEHTDQRVREVVAGNRHTPFTVLERMSSDVDWPTRAAIVSNPSCSVDLFRKIVLEAFLLGPEGSTAVHMAAIHSLGCPVEVLAALKQSCLVRVRHAVASCPRTPPDMLVSLSYDRDPYVRRAVCVNPNTADDVRKRLRQELGAFVDDTTEPRGVSDPVEAEGEQEALARLPSLLRARARAYFSFDSSTSEQDAVRVALLEVAIAVDKACGTPPRPPQDQAVWERL